MPSFISWAVTLCLILALTETTSAKPLAIRLAARQKRSLPPPDHFFGGDVHLFDADGHSVNDPDHLNPENAAMHTINEFVTEMKPEIDEEKEPEQPWSAFVGEYIWELPSIAPEEPDFFHVEDEYSGEEQETISDNEVNLPKDEYLSPEAEKELDEFEAKLVYPMEKYH